MWVHADTEATFSNDYETIARKLKIDKNSLNEKDLLQAVCDGIEALPNWVLILDNADDLKLFGVGQTAQETKTLLRYIPHASTGTVLWTTRDARIAGTLVGQGRDIEVARMRIDEAKRFLMTFRSAESSREADIDSLVEELQCLPLAIMQAGTYMNRTSTTPKEYLSLLAQTKKRWSTLKVSEFSRHRRPHVPNNVLETWTISIDRIRQESKRAYKILHVIAYVSYENIPRELITAAIKHIDGNFRNESELLESEAAKIITRLEEFSFIGKRYVCPIEGGGRNYEMHKLVQEAIRYGLCMNKSSTTSEDDLIQSNISGNRSVKQTSGYGHFSRQMFSAERKHVKLMNKRGDKEGEGEKYFATIALRTIAHLFPEPEKDTWTQCEKYLAHALQLGEWADVSEKQVETADLLGRASDFLGVLWRWREKEPVDKKILKFRQKIQGDAHLETIAAMTRLATTYHQRGRYYEEERLYTQAFETQREILGDRHPDTLKTVLRLASIYGTQGRDSEAESLGVQALSLLKRTQGNRHPDTIAAMVSLASTYFYQDRDSEAESLRVQALSLLKRIHGNRHPDTIAAMVSLALTYHYQGRHSEAKSLKVQVLEIQREILGNRHPATIAAMTNLASTYHNQGRHSKAESLQVQALDLLQEIFGDKHRDTINAMHSLALTWYSLDRHQDAIALVKQALRYSRSVLGPRHPCTRHYAESLQKFRSCQCARCRQTY